MLIKEAADKAGFNDPTAFTRWFAKECGLPPSAFRSGFSPPGQANVRFGKEMSGFAKPTASHLPPG
jgi:AraC-like DNA-binding protein